MNKTAQVSIFTLIFYAIIFIILLAGGLGYVINVMVGVAINNGSLTGLEAFMIANLILWFIIAFIIALFWWSR